MIFKRKNKDAAPAKSEQTIAELNAAASQATGAKDAAAEETPAAASTEEATATGAAKQNPLEGPFDGDDIERVKHIREAVGEEMILRLDANQGWSFDDALFALGALEKYNIEFFVPLKSRLILRI